MKLLILSLLLTLPSFATSPIDTNHEHIPYELSLLLKSLRHYNWEDDEYRIIAQITDRLNQAASQMASKDFLILTKSEIYKHFLEVKLPPPFKDSIMTITELRKFQKDWDDKRGDFPEIFQWLGMAALGDIKIYDQANFLDDLLENTPLKASSKSEAKAVRTIRYLSSWILYLQQVDQPSLLKQTKPLIINLLDKMSRNLMALAMLSPVPNDQSPKFVTKKIDATKSNKEVKTTKIEVFKQLSTQKELESLIQRIENNQQEDTQKQDWEPRDAK